MLSIWNRSKICYLVMSYDIVDSVNIFQEVYRLIILLKINPFLNKPWFLCVCSTRLLKTLLENRSVFYPLGELSVICIKFEIGICILFQFGRV